MFPRVCIIIVNWNGEADTLACLDSLHADAYPNKQILVVDNGSGDGSVAAIHRAFPEVIVVEAGANLGFTGGNNVGIRHALEYRADYVYLLNNDTTSESNALHALVKAAEANRELGIVTPVIHYFAQPEDVWFAGSRLELGRGIAVHNNMRIPAVGEAPYAVPWASGCAMLIRADLIRRLHGFDERYFLIWEDVDLSIRARAQGAGIAVVPAARIYHKVSKSVGLSPVNSCYYHVRNNLLLLRSCPGCGYRRAAIRVVLSRMREALRDIVRAPHHADRLGATVRAICDHALGRYGCRLQYRYSRATAGTQ